jgi:uncharacterized protein
MERLHEKYLGLDLRPLGLAAIAVGLIWSTSIAASSWKSVRGRPEQRTIKVTGSAKKRIVSDLIEWTATIEARAVDRTTAYKQLVDERAKALAFLAAQGIKASEIQPQSTTVAEEFDVQTELRANPNGPNAAPVRIEVKRSKGFVTTEAIVVRSPDVPRIEKASREITSLLEQGVSVTSEAPAYFYTRLGELKIEMLAAAAKDARSRADNILRSAGGAALGKLRVADMGIININPANSTETSEEGNNDRTSLEKDIITIVHAEFELDDD